MVSGARSATYQPPRAAQGIVLEELRHWIHSGRLQPGDKVLQEDVAANLGVSVVPIRESLKTLESEGLITHYPNRGFFVTKLSQDELLELCSIRSALETLAVTKALDGIDPASLTRMDHLIEDMVAADDAGKPENLIRLDREFHFALFEAAGSAQLLRIIEITWDQSDAYRSAFFLDPAHRALTHEEHREILAAIREGDAQKVSALLDAHRLTPIQTLGPAKA